MCECLAFCAQRLSSLLRYSKRTSEGEDRLLFRYPPVVRSKITQETMDKYRGRKENSSPEVFEPSNITRSEKNSFYHLSSVLLAPILLPTAQEVQIYPVTHTTTSHSEHPGTTPFVYAKKFQSECECNCEVSECER